jgi:hypothetical protein
MIAISKNENRIEDFKSNKHRNNNMRRLTFIICFTFISFNIVIAGDYLRRGFQNPPHSANARTWWHWMNGNVSREGITADLEAMKQVGIQEAQLFNVKLGLPFGGVEYLSEEWLELFKFAASEANRLGLELTFHNSAGWSSSGGPWITPENAMQTVVYSEVIVVGGITFKDRLPQPETRLDYYKDIAVLAFPKPQSSVSIDGLDYKNLSDRIRNHLMPDEKTIPASAIIKSSEIIDLTSKLSADGFLEWHAPKGEWVILRLGHTPIGKKNHPAVAGGHGLECDKMSKEAVDAFWAGGIQPIIDKLDTLIGTTVNNCLIDSYEVGATNWTSGFDKEFQTLRNYNCALYLPALAGYYVDGGEITERFLWDFRRTIGDLMAENYYAHFGELCHKNGMKFSVEPYWGPFDNMQVGATGDIVMCEFWSGGYPFFDSPKFVSSIAHLNGSSIVGAESFTGIGGWDEHPAVLKTIGDKAWAQGINRFIFHTFVHQPWEAAPGLALSYHGTDFNRLNTWWQQSKAYMDYIARSQFLLQQGKSVADVLVFTGESSPNTAFLMPEIKALGYDYDLNGVNKIFDLSVKGGKIYTPVGGEYRVLVLPENEWMRPETLQKLEQLAKAGATIIGSKPGKSPSLENYPKCDKQVKELAASLWNNQLIKDKSVVEFLNESKIPSDFMVSDGDPSDISFIHRSTDEEEIYFIANAKKENREEVCSFRVSGLRPELWNAETGEIIKPAVWKDNGNGTTSLPIQFDSEEAVFVIFQKAGNSADHIVAASAKLKKPQPEMLANLEIIKAEYGTFLQEGLVDITAVVANEVKDNQLNIQATRQFCDCDPAMGYIKEFRMEYSIGDKIHEIDVKEKEWVTIDAKNKGELKVLKAVFGKFKPETKGVPKHYLCYDITNKIKELLTAGVYEIPVNNQLIEGKTVEGNETSIRITYKTDGEERILLVPEGKTLRLSKNNPEPALISENGKSVWKTPYPGELTYTTSSGKTATLKVESVPEPIPLSGTWEVAFPGHIHTFDSLVSWSASFENDFRYFSGTAIYRKQFVVPEKLMQTENVLELDLGSVGVIAEVFVNGKPLGILWKAPFRINLDGHVQSGTNNLEVKVTNLWSNRLIGDEQLPLDYDRQGLFVKQWPEWIENPSERPSKRTTFASYSHYGKEDGLKFSGLLGPVIIRSYVKKILIGQ